jgi:hypothetical protein
MIRPILIAALALSAAVSPLAAAAQQQQRDAPDIVVTGERASKAREAAVRALTRAVAYQSDGQLARFAGAVCPAMVGFEDPYDKLVVDRITQAARDANVPVDTPGCSPNLTVIIVENGQAVLQALYKTKPGLFTALPPGERKRLLADRGPVHAMTFTELRDRDGGRVNAPSEARFTFDDLPKLLVHSASIMNPVTRQDINGSVILIDRAAAMGKSLRQIGDYAAMRALAKTNDAGAGNNTILSLFAPGAATPPPALTLFDQAYLAALYKGPATRGYLAKVANIAQTATRAGATATDSATAPPPQQ